MQVYQKNHKQPLQEETLDSLILGNEDEYIMIPGRILKNNHRSSSPKQEEKTSFQPETNDVFQTTLEQPIKIWVFREKELPKHTGLCFHFTETNEWVRHDVGMSNKTITRSQAPTTNYICDGTKFLHKMEAHEFAGVITSSKEKMFEYFNGYTWPYHLLSRNCRHHCKHVLQDLEKRGAIVARDAYSLVDSTEKGDKMVKIGAGIAVGVAIAIATLGALLYGFTRDDEEEKVMDEKRNKTSEK
jgi:hypothetical protein